MIGNAAGNSDHHGQAANDEIVITIDHDVEVLLGRHASSFQSHQKRIVICTNFPNGVAAAWRLFSDVIERILS